MDHDSNEWNSAERARLDALPRRLAPPPETKARVRARLRERGLLRSTESLGFELRWSVATAAAILIFVVGGLVGRVSSTLGSRETPVFATESTLAPAEGVQRAGSEYVGTVAALAAALDSIPAGTASQGRQVALSALRGAAEHLLQIPGNDERTERLLHELRGSRQP